jgi:hypothetical protein
MRCWEAGPNEMMVASWYMEDGRSSRYVEPSCSFSINKPDRNWVSLQDLLMTIAYEEIRADFSEVRQVDVADPMSSIYQTHNT